MYTTYEENSDAYPLIFWVKLFNGVGVNTGMKPEVRNQTWRPPNRKYLYFSSNISAPRRGRNEIRNARTTLLGTSFSMELFPTLWDETGSQKSKMAAAKPEVLDSQLLGEVETKFQMLYPHCWGPASQGSCFQYCGMKPEARNKKWRPPNRKYFYLGS